MATHGEDVQVQFGASIEGLTAIMWGQAGFRP
jgi:hypothetical protein